MNPADLLPLLARASAQAGVLALLVLAAQAVLRHRLAPRWRCALWLLVAARLALPVAPASPASLFHLFPALGRPANAAAGNLAPAPTDAASSDIAPPKPTAPPADAAGQFAELAPTPPAPSQASIPADPPSAPAPVPTVSPRQLVPPVAGENANPAPAATLLAADPLAAPPAAPAALPATSTDWPRLLLALWLAGFAAVLAALLWSSLALARRFRHARPLRDPAVAALLDDARRRLGLRVAPPLFECAGLAGPALHGCWRPRLLLPAGLAEKFSPDELRHVFLHELAHLRRHDLPVHWLLSLLQAAHWFNPLVWLAFARWRAERELACDALALETLGAGHNAAYGRTLLRLLESFAPQSPAPGLACLLENRDHLRRRVAQIAAFVPGRRRPLPAALLLAAFALAGLTDAQVVPPTPPPPTTATSSVSSASKTPVAPSPESSVSVAAAPTAATLAAPTAEPRQNVVERLSKVFRFAADPPEARAAVQPYLTPGARPGRGPGQPRVSLMLPSYQANEADLRSGGVERSRFLYYTYLVVNAVTDAGINDVNINQSFSMSSRGGNGSQAQSLLGVLEKLAAMPSVQTGSFEPRYYRFVVSRTRPMPAGVAGANVSISAQGTAIWLRSPSGKEDLIYLLAATGAAGLVPGTLYPAEQFNALMAAAFATPGEPRRPPQATPIPAAAQVAAPPAATEAAPANAPLPTGAPTAANVNAPNQFRFAAGPKDGAATVLAWLRRLSLPERLNIDPAKVSVLPPLPQYRFAGADAINNGSGPEAARPDGFHYALVQDGRMVGWANYRGTGSPVLSFGGDDLVQLIQDALPYLSTLPSLTASAYEARLLYLPPGPPFGGGNRTAVIWLAPVAGDGSDLLYWARADRPFATLQSGRVYPAKEFLDLIYPARKNASVRVVTPTAIPAAAQVPSSSGARGAAASTTIPPALSLPALSPPNGSNAPVSPTDASLAFAQTALEQAAALLDGATRETRPGLVEGALADLARALDDVAAARQMARAGSLSAYPPPAETPDEARLRAALSLTERDGGGAQPNMYGTLTFMKLALLSLQEAPGGDLNGLRPRLTADLAQAAARIFAGIEQADTPNPRGAPAPARSVAAATPAHTSPAGRWLDAADTALRNALGSLAGAGRAEHGGFVERATDAILDALAEARIAAATERARPAGPTLSPPNVSNGPNSPGYDQLLSDLAYSRPPGLRTQSNMTGTQAMLRAALLALQNTPGDNLGGARDRITTAIGRASAALRAGIEYADANEARAPRAAQPPRTAARGPAQPPSIVFAPPSAAPDQPDSATSRLLALQSTLQTVSHDIETAPPLPTGHTLDKAVVELRLALTEVAAGLVYLREHPETDVLPDGPAPVALPAFSVASLGPQIRANFPALTDTWTAFGSGLRHFAVGGGDTGPTSSGLATGSLGPVIGPLGGHRDKIIRSVSLASARLSAVLTSASAELVRARTGQPQPPVVSVVPNPAAFPPPQPGRISGRVVDTNGDPAANVLVSFAPRRSEAELRAAAIVEFTPTPPGSPPATGYRLAIDNMTPAQRQARIEERARSVAYAALVPATVSDAQGRFTIEDLPPGDYRLSAELVATRVGWGLSGSIQPVPVKPGEETKLTAPLQLR